MLRWNDMTRFGCSSPYFMGILVFWRLPARNLKILWISHIIPIVIIGWVAKTPVCSLATQGIMLQMFLFAWCNVQTKSKRRMRKHCGNIMQHICSPRKLWEPCATQSKECNRQNLGCRKPFRCNIIPRNFNSFFLKLGFLRQEGDGKFCSLAFTESELLRRSVKSSHCRLTVARFLPRDVHTVRGARSECQIETASVSAKRIKFALGNYLFFPVEGSKYPWDGYPHCSYHGVGSLPTRYFTSGMNQT